jgi:hypothetical protein
MSIDYLTNDPIIPTNQKYCVLSLYMNEDKKVIKCVKVSGAFHTLEEAQEIRNALNKITCFHLIN